jgi:hypothetical protein
LIPVPLIDLKFLSELAAVDAGASNRRHACGELEIPIISPQVLLGISNSKTALESKVS